MVPIRLREEMGLEIGQTYDFYVHRENGDAFICIKCPKTSQNKIEKAIELLEENGIHVAGR